MLLMNQIHFLFVSLFFAGFGNFLGSFFSCSSFLGSSFSVDTVRSCTSFLGSSFGTSSFF